MASQVRTAAAGLLLDEEGLWIVLNLGTGGSGNDGGMWWTPPGGSVDPDESPERGMTPEVWEETGLVVTSCSLAFSNVVDRPSGRLLVHTYLCHTWVKSAWPGDPDGSVVSAERLPVAQALARVDATSQPWVSRPLAWFLEHGPSRTPKTFHFDTVRSPELERFPCYGGSPTSGLRPSSSNRGSLGTGR